MSRRCPAEGLKFTRMAECWTTYIGYITYMTNERAAQGPGTVSTAVVSQNVRAQLAKMGIPFRTVRTVLRPSGNFTTRVYAFDVASAAEALRTLHPEHQVLEYIGFALLVSDGQV